MKQLLPLLLTLTIFSCATPKYLKCPKGPMTICSYKQSDRVVKPLILVNWKEHEDIESIDPSRIVYIKVKDSAEFERDIQSKPSLTKFRNRTNDGVILIKIK